jgi:hypothetical protein
MPMWMMISEWGARLILAFLFGLSIYSISIILERRSYFKKFDLAKVIDEFLPLLKNQDQKKIQLELFLLKKKLEKNISFLGTLGSTTPFVGLLGTILGIIVSFGKLSVTKTDTNIIMFSLAEALILTAVGLVVAIPAVVAYNFFQKKIKMILEEVKINLN